MDIVLNKSTLGWIAQNMPKADAEPHLRGLGAIPGDKVAVSSRVLSDMLGALVAPFGPPGSVWPPNPGTPVSFVEPAPVYAGILPPFPFWPGHWPGTLTVGKKPHGLSIFGIPWLGF